MNMEFDEHESSRHLFQQPLYKVEGGSWQKYFDDSVREFNGRLTWDPAAILSINSFGYVVGDRTLVKEIKRRPWLSQINKDGSIFLEEVPEHGRLWNSQDNIAARLEDLLCQEASEACAGYKKIYILLSGGLDSRIVAGVIHKLCKSGQITSDVVCVTWGFEDCSDVVYGKFISELIGFKWQHVPINWGNLLENLGDFSISTGAMVSPVHLHRMDWFRNIEKNSIVLGGSYGDSVGRAEYSGRHLLELDYPQPVNTLGLINKSVLLEGVEAIERDLEKLYQRCEDRLKYALCECAFESNYMRNMLAHIMSVINSYSRVYQMFTHPDVYGYMWSLHPSLRDDGVYAKLLKRLDSKLASMPWSRTGRALEGKTAYTFNNRRKDFHSYKSWVSGPIYEKLRDYVSSSWFGETGLFDREKIEDLSRLVESKSKVYGFAPYERWIWLASFRKMAEHIKSMGKDVVFEKKISGEINIFLTQGKPLSFLRRYVNTGSVLCRLVMSFLERLARLKKKYKRKRLKKDAILKFPPVDISEKGMDV